MTTFTKDLIAKNQKKIVRDFGGVRNFVSDVEHIAKSYHGNVWRAIYEAYSGMGFGEVYYEDQYNYLKRTIPNFKEDIYFYKRKDEWGQRVMKTDKVQETYAGMLATAGTRLYESLKEGKNPLTAKKKPVKKK